MEVTNAREDRGAGAPFGIAMKGDVLRHQMRLRGLTGSGLAHLTRLSDATISNALAGRRLHPTTFRKIVAQLEALELLSFVRTRSGT